MIFFQVFFNFELFSLLPEKLGFFTIITYLHWAKTGTVISTNDFKVEGNFHWIFSKINFLWKWCIQMLVGYLIQNFFFVKIYFRTTSFLQQSREEKKLWIKLTKFNFCKCTHYIIDTPSSICFQLLFTYKKRMEFEFQIQIFAKQKNK